MKKWILILFATFYAQCSYALVTEVGLQYGRKKTSFDAKNSIDSESLTTSLSFYVMEKIALELSYTKARGIREEYTDTGPAGATFKQTVVQDTTVLGADLIFVFGSRKNTYQPYIKGGAAQINRKQEMKFNDLDEATVEPKTSIAPSYGVGMKIAITDAIGIKISWDAWQTPVGDGTYSDDSQVRAGLNWLL